MTEPKPHHEDESDLPVGLVEDLSRLYAPDLEVPEALDERVLTTARQQFARQRRQRLVLRVVQVTAAAAAIVMVVWVFDPAERGAQPDRPVASVAAIDPQDLDRSGRVDILDAYLLARQLETETRRDERWDFDENGTVDRRDVDAVAMAAVRLNGGMVQ